MTVFQRDTAFERMDRSSGGLVEAVKTGVIMGVREVLKGSTFTNDAEHLEGQADDVWVDMEYPTKVENYPGIWVQFSITSMQPSGMGHVTQGDNDELIQQWMYEGRVSLLIVAMSSIQRDRIADAVLNEIAFQDVSHVYGLDDERVTLQKVFNDNPYVSIGINQGSIRPAGQSITVGTPFEDDALVYEDNYGFDVMGEFQRVRDARGAYKLRRIDLIPENVTLNGIPKNQWV